MTEAFVYIWTDKKDHKFYIGCHKGTPDDGYVCSSEPMLEQYALRPGDFSRVVLAQGDWAGIRFMENLLLERVDAIHNPIYYNQSNGNSEFYLKYFTEAHKQKLKKARKGRTPMKGKHHSEKTKQKMRGRVPWNKGKAHPLETRKKLSVWQIGRTLTEEHKRNIGLGVRAFNGNS